MSFNIIFKVLKELYGRYNGICPTSLVIIHLLLERLYAFIIKLFCPVDESAIVFNSLPDFSDNARALAEYMESNGYTMNYRIFFDVENSDHYNSRGGKIVFITCKAKYGKYKLSSLHTLYTAKYLMSTHKMIINKRNAQKNQVLVRLWHGCSFKDRSSQDGKSLRPFDVALVPGKLFVKTKAYFWNVEDKYILPVGYPRYDWLKMKDENAQKLINIFKLNKDTKILLWMPTFRIDKRGKCSETNSLTQFPMMDSNEKWEMIDRLCVEHNIIMIVKLHPLQTDYGISFESFSNIKIINDQILDKVDIPLYKFVALTDALLSDYSSIAIDYLLVNRPMGFTLDDYEEYKNARGFLVDDPRVYMPGHHLYTFEDMRLFFLDLADGKDKYKEQREHVRDKLIACSDNYCKSILDRLSIRK